MADSIIGPTSHYFYSQRLKLHYVDWGNADKPLMVLVHGGRDHCRNWDWVALDLRSRYHVIAPDLRGHGDSDWAIGGGYSMIDYVLDLAQLMQAVSTEPATLIGHSLGGKIVLQYAGVHREVKQVVSIEGMGPPPGMIRETPAYERMKNWIAQMRDSRQSPGPRVPEYRRGARRMRAANPHLSEEQARHLTIWGVRRNENGTYSWKFDNYVHATSPYMFNTRDARQIWERITCPTFLIRGSESWAGDWVKDGRFAAFKNARDSHGREGGALGASRSARRISDIVHRFLEL